MEVFETIKKILLSVTAFTYPNLNINNYQLVTVLIIL